MRILKLLANFALFVFVTFGIYIKYMENAGVLDCESGYDFFDLDVFGKLLVVLLNLSLFPTVIISMKNAWGRGQYLWVYLNMLFFPAVYYLHYLYTDIEDETAFKDITKRVNK